MASKKSRRNFFLLLIAAVVLFAGWFWHRNKMTDKNGNKFSLGAAWSGSPGNYAVFVNGKQLGAGRSLVKRSDGLMTLIGTDDQKYVYNGSAWVAV